MSNTTVIVEAVPLTIKGTATERNIVAAYLSESAAYTRYSFYAKQAAADLFFPVELAFLLTADNEMHHAKTFFKLLGGGSVKVTAPVDAGVIGSTARNLAIAAREERTEGVDTYLAAARQAEADGFADIAAVFRAMASIEARHQQRYDALLAHVKHGTMWIRPNPVTWHCSVCGYETFASEPPTACPACSHPHQHFLPMDIAFV